MSMDRPNNSSDAWDIQCQSSATTTTTRDATDEREARERRAKVNYICSFPDQLPPKKQSVGVYF